MNSTRQSYHRSNIKRTTISVSIGAIVLALTIIGLLPGAAPFSADAR
jgi:hypothetical protein